MRSPTRAAHALRLREEAGPRLVSDTPTRDDDREPTVSVSEVLGALSFALDLTEGQPPGHVLRTCAIGMWLADVGGLSAEDRSSLYYALLLKDAGCSSNASRMAALFGSDDHIIKRAVKELDWQRRPQSIAKLWPLITVGGSLAARCWQVARIAARPGASREAVTIRCDRGASIARRLGFPIATADAIRSLDEHWNGHGLPDGLRGTAIPLLARIASLAQTFEVFARRDGITAAVEVARSRRGRWFDPALVDLLTGTGAPDDAWWYQASDEELARGVAALEPTSAPRVVDRGGLDTIAAAFAEIIDAKAPFTYQHSTNVAALAARIGQVSGIEGRAHRLLVRAALLHDIGKLGVSNRILDKPAALTSPERLAVEQHPVYTLQILERVAAFREFAATAAWHHERLDGSGYPWGLRADQLDTAARTLAVADVYEALTAERPYRAPLQPSAALALMARGRSTQFCSLALDALEAVVLS